MSTDKILSTLIDVEMMRDEKMERSFTRTNETIDNQAAAIERLTLQIGNLASACASLRAVSREMVTAIQEQQKEIRGQNTVAQTQAENVNRLIALAELQQGEMSKQYAAIDKLLGAQLKIPSGE